MQELLDRLLAALNVIPTESVYLLIAAGAAVENVFPPVPSDMFVILGGVLADRQILEWELVFLSAWAANLALGCVVYAMGRRYGRALFDTRWGEWILRPHQLQRMSAFYERYGALTILVSRFFPVFRVLVPAFAGISRLSFWRTVLPLGAAAAIWYGVLVWAGILASRNIPRLMRWFETANTWLVAMAGLLALVLGVWWWRTRQGEAAEEGGER